MAISMRAVLACCVLLLLGLAPAHAAAPPSKFGAGGSQASTGASSACVPKGGPYTKDCEGKCCKPLKCLYTSVGGGYFCQ